MTSRLTFCQKCGGIVRLKRDSKGQPRPNCIQCGFIQQEVDPKAYSASPKSPLGKTDETVIIDREKQVEQLKKDHGPRNPPGPGCPSCLSMYITKSLLVTRGDEAGKTFWHCLACGHTFRRWKYIHAESKAK